MNNLLFMSFRKYCNSSHKNSSQHPLFVGDTDRFNGITINTAEEKCDLKYFTKKLQGVGALVFNGKNELLAISEKHYQYPHWKLPGGYVESGEDIKDAAPRAQAQRVCVGENKKGAKGITDYAWHSWIYSVYTLRAVVSDSNSELTPPSYAPR
ncbi:unnamed protein product, partial [Iphiclides podalirius]